MSSSYKIALAVAAVLLLSAVLYYANSGGDETDATPADALAAQNDAASPALPDAAPPTTPDTRTLRLGNDPARVAERNAESARLTQSTDRPTIGSRRLPEIDAGSLTLRDAPEPPVAAANTLPDRTPPALTARSGPITTTSTTTTGRFTTPTTASVLASRSDPPASTGLVTGSTQAAPADSTTTGAPTRSAPVRDAAASGPVSTYEVQPNDNFWKIAEAQYGDDRHWRTIAQANPSVDPTRLAVGQKLRMPSRASLPDLDPTDPVVEDPGQGRRYRIRPGDTLSEISQEVYGTAASWQLIYNANRQAIGDNPSKLSPGMTLSIPPRVATR
ncbi:MAG: LysM peptidoglycan-binding domain-containing protein [Planctomycetota bacterium]